MSYQLNKSDIRKTFLSKRKEMTEDVINLKSEKIDQQIIEELERKNKKLEDKIKILKSNSPAQQQEESNNIRFFSHQNNESSSDKHYEESVKTKVG